MKIISLKLLPAFLCGSLFLHSSSKAEDSTSAEEPTPLAATTEKGEHALLPTLETSGYTVFAELLRLTGIAAELDITKTYTCFAPNNDAFNMETVGKIRSNPEDEEVAALLRYHLIEGLLPEKILIISRRVESLSGKYLLFWVSDGKVSINKYSEIAKTDIVATNAVIHGVSKILNPDVPGAIP